MSTQTLEAAPAPETRAPGPPPSATWIRIQPSRGWRSLGLRELWEFRDLLTILAGRDVKLRYKQTALGVIWVVLQPLMASAIFALIFGYFVDLPSDGVPYLLFVFAGLLPWSLFASSLQRAGTSLISDARLISKVYFPRLIIPVASTLAVLLDFLVALAVMALLLLLYQTPMTPNLLVLPAVVLLSLALAVGASLWVAALNVYYRDFLHALPFLVQVLMYASPVVYPSSVVPPAWRGLYALNPMVGVVDGFRWSLLGTGSFPWHSLAVATLAAALILVSGAMLFRRVERSFADVL